MGVADVFRVGIDALASDDFNVFLGFPGSASQGFIEKLLGESIFWLSWLELRLKGSRLADLIRRVVLEGAWSLASVSPEDGFVVVGPRIWIFYLENEAVVELLDDGGGL